MKKNKKIDLQISTYEYEFSSEKYPYLQKAFELSEKDGYSRIFDLGYDNPDFEIDMARNCHKPEPTKKELNDKKYIRGLKEELSIVCRRYYEIFRIVEFKDSFSIYIKTPDIMSEELHLELQKIFKDVYQKYAKTNYIDIDLRDNKTFMKIIKYNVLNQFEEWFLGDRLAQKRYSLSSTNNTKTNTVGVYSIPFDFRLDRLSLDIEEIVDEIYRILRSQEIITTNFKELDFPWTTSYIERGFDETERGFESKEDILEFISDKDVLDLSIHQETEDVFAKHIS